MSFRIPVFLLREMMINLSEPEEKIYEGLAEYGYSRDGILKLKLDSPQLGDLLEALREWAVKVKDEQGERQ
jgi:hypothetical protein